MEPRVTVRKFRATASTIRIVQTRGGLFRANCDRLNQMKKKPSETRRRSGLRATGQRARKKTGVSIIGAGRMGSALALALKGAGYRIDVVVTKRPSHARRAARIVDAGTLGFSIRQLARLDSTQEDALRRTSVILIATPDDAIAEVADRLAAIFKSDRMKTRTQRVAMHTSGALSSEALRSLHQAGFAIGSLHPLVSISDSILGAKSFAHAFFSIEGDPAALRQAKLIVRDLAGQSFTIKARQKALYHAAAVMTSPHMVALFDLALEMFGRCGVPAGRARQVLLPLLESTVTNLSTQNPAQALTGTFKRGDVATVQRHIAALESEQLREALRAYVLLGQRSLSLVKSRQTRAALEQIKRILSQADVPPR
jgi:predicted short-subunit dehydrogenase-like oxidoreductase (DUF2520 family)